MKSLERTGAAFAFTALILLLVVAFGATNYNWAGWQPALCYPQHCFCESALDNPIRQPSNTYSNLAYVLVGALILSGAYPGQRTNRMSQQPAYARLYGVAVTAVGLGSLFYHGSLTAIGNWFDVMGMYLVAVFLVLYALARLRSSSGTRFTIMYTISIVLLGIALIVEPPFRREIFGALILIAIALEGWYLKRKPQIEVRFWFGALFLFVAAYGVWILDNSGLWCDPTSWLQGHAVWHILAAGAAGLMFVYYRSEEQGAKNVSIETRGA